MGVGEADAIVAALIAAGKPASLPVAIVENASLPERAHDLHDAGASCRAWPRTRSPDPR